MGEFKRYCFIVLASAILLAGGCNGKSESEPVDISVSSSYLGSGVKDIAGDGLDVFSIVPPGMCPGHFDISPSQVVKVSNSRILFIFGFQERMKESLSSVAGKRIRIETIKPNVGLCVPETYVKVCKQICDVLCEYYPENSRQYREKLEELKTRTNNLEKRIKDRIDNSGLKGEKVICSVHQKKFARWLGLLVVGTFEGRDTETAGSLNKTIKAGVKQKTEFVIANKQEGTRLAEVIAERLGARTVVFSNFPETGKKDSGFIKLVEQNINKLTGTGE